MSCDLRNVMCLIRAAECHAASKDKILIYAAIRNLGKMLAKKEARHRGSNPVDFIYRKCLESAKLWRPEVDGNSSLGLGEEGRENDCYILR